MSITKENYEAYFLDYYEDNLSKAQVDELMDFLEQNPGLKKEFTSFEMISLKQDSSIVMKSKSSLKKNPETNPEYSDTEKEIIAFHEGDLDEKSKTTLLEKVEQSPQLQKDFSLYGKTYLQAETDIIFPRKSSLKHFTLATFTPLAWQIAAAAMVIGVLAGVYFLMPKMDDIPSIADYVPPVSESIIPEPKEEAETQKRIAKTPQSQESSDLPVAEKPMEVLPQQENEISSEFQPQASTRQLAQLPSHHHVSLHKQAHPTKIELRQDFKGVTWNHLQDIKQRESAPQETRQSWSELESFTSMAYNGLENRTGINLRQMEKDVSERRYGLWDLAGAGLSGLSRLTGTSLTLDKERDEDGRITLLAIGEHLKIER